MYPIIKYSVSTYTDSELLTVALVQSKEQSQLSSSEWQSLCKHSTHIGHSQCRSSHAEHPPNNNRISPQIVPSSSDSSCMWLEVMHLSYANWCLTALPCIQWLTPPSVKWDLNVGCWYHGNRQAYYGNEAVCRPCMQTNQAWMPLSGWEMDGGKCRERDEERM